MDARSLISLGAARLMAAGIGEASREAELLFLHATQIQRVALYRDNPDVPSANAEAYVALIKRRASREPMYYILGEVGFMGLRLRVGPGVLVPRPETELLVEEALRLIAPMRHPHVLDLCTGSGAIALAIAHALPAAELTATELSADALAYAKASARINKIDNVRFLEGHLFVPVAGMKFELIVSNPPYIPAAEIASLEPEVSVWEPREALDGGPDGLDFYREILTGALCYLDPPGIVMLELGAGQSGAVASIAASAGQYGKPEFVRDLAGHERIAILRLGRDPLKCN